MKEGRWLEAELLLSSFPAADRRARRSATELLLWRGCRDLSIPISSTSIGTRSPTKYLITDSAATDIPATHPVMANIKIRFAPSSCPPHPYSTATRRKRADQTRSGRGSQVARQEDTGSSRSESQVKREFLHEPKAKKGPLSECNSLQSEAVVCSRQADGTAVEGEMPSK